MAVRRKTTEASFLDPSMAPWVLVSEVYWMSYKLMDRRLYDLGITASQARALAVIHSSGEPIKPTVLAMLLFQESQSVTGIVNRMESQGWIDREPDPNHRRACRVKLTASGRKLAEQINTISRELYEDLFTTVLTAAEAKSVAETLKKVRARAFQLPETDFKLRRARQYPIWSD